MLASRARPMTNAPLLCRGLLLLAARLLLLWAESPAFECADLNGSFRLPMSNVQCSMATGHWPMANGRQQRTSCHWQSRNKPAASERLCGATFATFKCSTNFICQMRHKWQGHLAFWSPLEWQACEHISVSCMLAHRQKWAHFRSQGRSTYRCNWSALFG